MCSSCSLVTNKRFLWHVCILHLPPSHQHHIHTGFFSLVSWLIHWTLFACAFITVSQWWNTPFPQLCFFHSHTWEMKAQWLRVRPTVRLSRLESCPHFLELAVRPWANSSTCLSLLHRNFVRMKYDLLLTKILKIIKLTFIDCFLYASHCLST